MKLTLDFGGGDDERSKLLARAYVAAVVGPLRRPNGRPRQVQLTTTGDFEQVANNNTADQVMFVNVSITSVGNQPLDLSVTTSGGTQFRQPIPPTSCILYPGESLAVAATAGPATISVVTETF